MKYLQTSLFANEWWGLEIPDGFRLKRVTRTHLKRSFFADYPANEVADIWHDHVYCGMVHFSKMWHESAREQNKSRELLQAHRLLPTDDMTITPGQVIVMFYALSDNCGGGTNPCDTLEQLQRTFDHELNWMYQSALSKLKSERR